MITWLHRWLYTDLFIPVWPNLVAACIPTLTVLQLVKIVKRHHREHMNKMHQIHEAVKERKDNA